MAERRFLSLRWRLTGAFVVLALAAVALVAALAAWSANDRVGSLVRGQHKAATSRIVAALATAYRDAGGWAGADLSAAQALASAAGAELSLITPDDASQSSRNSVLRAGTGSAVAPAASPARSARGDASARPTASAGTGTGTGQTGGNASTGPSSTPAPVPGRSQQPAPGGVGSGTASVPSGQPTPARSTPGPSPAPTATSTVGGEPITVDGSVVGFAVISFPAATGSSAEVRARDAILRTIGIGAALAAALAVLAGLFASRRITRPVTELVAATNTLGAGEPAPALPTHAPGELGELARSFQRMAEQLSAAETARRALVADVAHELRTPVTILRAATEELVDGIVAPEPQRLASLHDEVLRLGRIVEDLGSLAAADAAGLHVDLHPVDLAEVAAQTVDLLQPQAADAGLTISICLQPCQVLGDGARLGQVVTNLITNAIKFTPSSGQITVAVQPQQDDAVLSVSDTGPGIPPADLPHVFERFWRGQAARSSSGSGIGLAVVERLVTVHHGTVQAHSLPTGGAEFVVRIPAVKTPAAATRGGRA